MDKRIRTATLYSPHGAKVVVTGQSLWVCADKSLAGHTIHDRGTENRIVAAVPKDWAIVLEWP